jgi:Spy/CpxP family protein refolding chaperone
MAVAGGGIALAQQAPSAPPAGQQHPHGHHRGGLMGEALRLDSLTPSQKTAIEGLVSARRSAEVPVRQADAVVLTQLAQQVDQAAIDPSALAPAVQARDSAAAAARAVDKDTLQRLHDTLTPAQRAQIVDDIEARFAQRAPGGRHHKDAGAPGAEEGKGHHGPLGHLAKRLGLTPDQEQQIAARLQAERQAAGGAHPQGDRKGEGKAWLESFRGDAFTAAGPAEGMGARGGEHLERLLAAAVPVLTPAQRAQLSSDLRARAAHMTTSHG